MEDYTNMQHVGNLRPTSELKSFLSTTFVRGYSAYEIAVQNGYVGTEEEWLESLIGPQGEQGPQGIQGIQGIQGETGNGISYVRLNADYSLTIYFTNGTSINLGNIRGEKGEKGDTGERGPQGYTGETGARGPTGNGISHAVLNPDYTLTIFFTDGTSTNIGNIRGEQGEPAVSPMARVVQTSTGAILFVDDIHGSTYAQIANGQKGDKGDTGERGPQGYQGEKGDPGDSFELHACSQDEYDPVTRIPTIENPDTSTLYLVPSAEPLSPDLFVEWVYVNNNWEMFGSATVEAVTDVQVNGSSIVTDGVANIPVASANDLGVVKVSATYGTKMVNGTTLGIDVASSTNIKAGETNTKPVSPYHQHESTFYGLAKAAGDVTQSSSSNTVGTYTPEAKAAIQTMLGITSEIDDTAGTGDTDKTWSADKISSELENAGTVQDVTINGTSIVSDGVANIPRASDTKLGAVAVSDYYGVGIVTTGADAGILKIVAPTDAQIKAGANNNRAVNVANQHKATFYGLAKVAGDTTQSESSNAVGNYTDSAKASIKQMLGITDSTQTVTVSGTEPVITAVANTRYICGEVISITITPPASGICEVVFTSGSTVAVLSATGVTFPEWFDPTSLETNTTYELSIADGRGAVAMWVS